MNDEPRKIWLELGEAPASRLDKALAAVAPEGAGLSRSRIVALIREGCLTTEAGERIEDPRARPVPHERYALHLPEATELTVTAEDIPLDVVHEDADLIVVNKPAGMVVHPAPGTASGTLVNALLHHCRESLSGIGGAKRPGIVHRIDKDTSGLLVVAKTNAAHQGLAAQFADHSLERMYQAVVWGMPSPGDPRLSGLRAVRFETGGVLRISAPLARHPADRKKMAVVGTGGRHAVTRVTVERALEGAALVACRLETGRTHQIRVHLTHVGHPLIGDPVYGRARQVPSGLDDARRAVISGFSRQALHAKTLGFLHPVSGEFLRFSADMPDDMRALIRAFEAGSAR